MPFRRLFEKRQTVVILYSEDAEASHWPLQRTEDWLRQSRKDLSHSKKSLEMEDFEWACFSAQQSAEKAVKAVYQSIRAYAHGHSVSALLQRLPRRARPDARLIVEAKLLDRHYIPTRYPNSHPQGAPMDYYTKQDAMEAVRIAERIIRYCSNRIRGAKEKS